MNIGDMYAYIDRLDEEGSPVRLPAMVLRIDNPGVGLELPQLTCTVFSLTEDPNHGGMPFQSTTGLYPFGSNYPNTFEPIEAP